MTGRHVPAAAPEPDPGTAKSGPHSYVPVAAILALAALLRLINANADLWYDEIITVIYFVRTPLVTVVSTYGFANNHVLNSALMNVAASIIGTDPWVLRLPAILFGIAGVWAFWLVARQIWPRPPALLGTLLFAVSYHHIYYSQSARGYSAFLFFTLLATGCLLRLLERGKTTSRMNEIGYCVALALGLYSMLLTTFVVAAHASALLILRRWRALAWLAAGVGMAIMLYAPMGASLVAYYRTNPGETGYRLLSWEFARAMAPVAPLLLVAGAILLPLAGRLARRQPLAAALLLAPALFNLLIPLVRGQGVYPRSFIYLLCLGYLLVTEVLDWAMSRRSRLSWAGAVVVIIIAMSCVKLAPYYSLPKQAFRQALAYVDQHARPSDQRVGLTLGGKAARFYDPDVVLVETGRQLRALTSNSDRPAWVLTTFHNELRSNAPDLYEWLRTETSQRAEFAGVIGDGNVYVHYWPGSRRAP